MKGNTFEIVVCTDEGERGAHMMVDALLDGFLPAAVGIRPQSDGHGSQCFGTMRDTRILETEFSGEMTLLIYPARETMVGQ